MNARAWASILRTRRKIGSCSSSGGAIRLRRSGTSDSRLYEAIENGIVDVAGPSLKDRIGALTAVRDQAQADAERATSAVERLGPAITSDSAPVRARCATC